AIDFHMPCICSPLVRPGREAEAAPVISKQLSDTILRQGIIFFIIETSMINMEDLCLVSGKAAWMAYLDVYCLDADGALFDAALFSAVAAFSSLEIPTVSLNDEGRVVIVVPGEGEPINGENKKLNLKTLPFSLTCLLHKNYIVADPTAEEESVMETYLTVVLDSSTSRLLSLSKPGGSGLAQKAEIQECVEFAGKRVKELKKILNEAISDMDVD
ncbi:hypothetical protein M569_06274, partial [Genlisea aurea]